MEEKTTRRFELICIVMLSFGQICIMTNYETLTLIQESVIHSIHEKEPWRISEHAGYYGETIIFSESKEIYLIFTQAVCFMTYVFVCFVSPSFLYATSVKTTLFISAVCFTAYPIGFFSINSYYYYFSSAVLGVGFAFYYTGNAGYMTSHSTRQTIGANVSLSWGLGCFSMMIGGIIMAIITFHTGNEGGHITRKRFSDFELYLFFSVFTIISSIAVVIFLFIPSKDVTNCIESSKKDVSFWNGMQLMGKTFMSPEMFRLAPTFVFLGIHTSFFLAVYPTTLTFNMHNAAMVYLPALYSFSAGLGETLMGLTISTMSKRFMDFSVRPTMLIGCTATIIYCVLVLFTTPYDSTTTTSTVEPLLLQPSCIIIFIIGFLTGITDCCLCSVRSTICALTMPSRRDQAYSVSKIYQSFGMSAIFFISPWLNIYHYVIGISSLCVFACFLFFVEAQKIEQMECSNRTHVETSADASAI